MSDLLRHIAPCLLLLLAACTGERHVLSRDFMAPEIVERPEPTYCYRTLGTPDCHRAPVSGERHRLVEYYGAPPEHVVR